jgi:hypothetical protein
MCTTVRVAVGNVQETWEVKLCVVVAEAAALSRSLTLCERPAVLGVFWLCAVHTPPHCVIHTPQHHVADAGTPLTMPPPRNGLRSSARGTVLVALQLLLLQWPPLLLRTTSSSAVMAAAAAAAAAASTAPRAPALAEQVVQLRSAAAAQPHSPLPRVQLALALHELNHMLPDGGSRVPEAEREYRWVGRWSWCRALLPVQPGHHTDAH